MKILVNYSHPLNESAREQLRALEGEFEEVLIKTQIDLDKAIKSQLDGLVQQCPRPFHLLIPPALPVAAGYVTARLSLPRDTSYIDLSPDPPPLVVLKRDDSLPPQFVVAEVVRGGAA